VQQMIKQPNNRNGAARTTSKRLRRFLRSDRQNPHPKSLEASDSNTANLPVLAGRMEATGKGRRLRGGRL
jgi:hypothetical protein